MRRTFPRHIGLWLLLLAPLGAPLVSGQRADCRNGPVAPPLPFEGQGTVLSIGVGLIRMVSAEGQPYVLQIGRRTLVEVRGTCGLDMLRPGVCVRFKATLAGRRSVAGEIAELTVFSRADPFGMGVQPAATRSAPDDDGLTLEADFGSATAPASGTAGARREPSRSTRRRPSQPANSPVLIAGLVRSYHPRKGILMIVAGAAGPIKGRVANAAKVKLYTADYRFVQPGDTVTHVTGTTTQPGVVTAKKVTIEVTTPPPAEPGRSPRRTGHRSRRSDRDQVPTDDRQSDVTGRQQP